MSKPSSRPFTITRPAPRLLRWGLVAAWMTVIFMASADTASGEHSGALVRAALNLAGLEATPERLELVGLLLRKASHFTEYAILALLWAWALPGSRWRLGIAWVASTLYAGSDELHQAFVPGRGPALLDVGIDALGAATALLLSRLWRRRAID